VVRIAISQAAFEAIARTLPLGSVSFENKSNTKGERYVWLEPAVVARLRVLREPSWRAGPRSSRRRPRRPRPQPCRRV
jgi:hypothetical protein